MLQNNRFGNNLASYRNDIPIIDTSVTSDQYFRLFNVPDKLYVGKNSFRMRANMDALVKGSNIYVDIVDSTGKIIYHEFADFIGKDKSRLIVAHIYENTAPGEATIYIAGRTKVDMRNGNQIPYQTSNANASNHIDYPNIMWIGKVVVVPNEQNNDEVFYITPPIVTTFERKEYYNKLTNPAERVKTLTGTGLQSVSIQSVTQGNTYSNTSKYSTKFDENVKQVELDPKQSGTGVQSNFQSIPLYRELSVIRANGFEFNSDMIGGKITVSGLNELLNIGYDVPPYEFHIIDIIDKTSVKISPNFKLVTKGNDGEIVIDKFVNATDFVITYYSSDVELTSVATESFIQLDIKNLEPAAGNVDSVKISYKPYGSFGSNIDIGTFKISEQNYLVDPSTIIATKNDLVEFPIGDVRNPGEFNTYWDLIELKNSVSLYSASIFDKGIQIERSGVGPEPLNEYDYYFKVKDDYSIQSITDTEYKLQFSIKFGDKLVEEIPQQVDIYISGSAIISDVQKDKLVNPAQRKNEYGQFIGTVSNQGTSKLIDSKVYFKTLDDEQIVPIFMSKNSEVIEVKNIIIAPRNELGFTPNMAKLILPVNNFKTDTELTINVDYLTGTNKKADQNTKVYGLQFTGSNAIQNEIDKVKEELETQILVISGSIGSGSVDLGPIEDAIEDLQDDVFIINNNISIIEGDITNIEGDIVTINNDILTITNDITVIFGDIVDINTEIGDIYDEIDTINDLITDIYDDYVPITREIEINGVTHDLSTDVSFTIDIYNIYNTDGEIEADRLVYSDAYQLTFDTVNFLVGGPIGNNGRIHLWNGPSGVYGFIENGDGFMDFRNDPSLPLFNVDNSGGIYFYDFAGNYANITSILLTASQFYQLPDASGIIFLKPTGTTGQYVDGTGALQTSVYGTVTSFSAGDLSPLFTTTESTVTSTPTLTFALSNAGGNTYFGRLSSTGAPSYVSAGAFTKTDDTNVTLTLGGAHATSVLAAMSVTLGWTGQLAISRGGTGLGSLGTANQLLRVNSGATALEYFTPTWTTNTGTVTNFSAGDLSPLFTTSEATTTTTPALTFTLTSSVTQYQVFGRTSSGTGAPSWITLPASTFTAGNYVSLTTISGYHQNAGALDANTITTNSELYVQGGSNTPYPWGHLKTMGVSSTYAWQLFNPITSNAIFTRSAGGGAYSAWEELGIWNNNSGMYSPKSGITSIVTTDPSNAIGDIVISSGGASWAGMLIIRTPAKSNVGYIGYFQDRMYYEVIVGSGWHEFGGTGAYVKLNTIPHYAAATQILVNNSGVISYASKSDLSIGSVTNFSAGDLSPLFTTSEATTTTTPALTFTLTSSVNQYQVFGRTSSGTGSPSWITLDASNFEAQYWIQVSTTYVAPLVADQIRTRVSGAEGYVSIVKGDGSYTGYVEFLNTSASRIGYIGYYQTYMNYDVAVVSGYHGFTGGPIRIASVANDNALTKVAVLDANNEIKHRTISANVDKDSKAATFRNVSASITTDFFYTDTQIICTSVAYGSSGTSPNVTFFVRFATARNGSFTEINSSGYASSGGSAATGAVSSGFTTATIPAGSWIQVRCQYNSGTVTDAHLTLTYTK